MKKLMALAPMIAATLLVTGCSSADPVPDTAAKAQLDRARGQVVLPLEEYQATVDELNVTQRASQSVLRECLNGRGHAGLAPAADSTGPGLDRPYGLWLPEQAAQEGFIPAVDQSAPPPGEWSDESDPSFNAAYDACRGEVGAQMDAVSIPEAALSGGLPGELATKAYNSASATDAWKTAREEWTTCLRDHGLTPRDDESAWTSAEAQQILEASEEGSADPARKKEEIRIASIEADCNEKGQLTQRLGDIEASYQAPLIKQNEAALQDVKAETAKHVDAARAYLASHQ